MNKEFDPTTTPDAVPGNWVQRAPKQVQPYLRLMRADRPIGTWLLFLPCLWGLGFGAINNASSIGLVVYYAVLFAIGSFAMRGAGCAYNDIVDRDFDGQVARTALRPIPAGEISLKQAWGFLAFLGLVGLVILLQLNRFTIFLGIASLGLVAIYPFMKRITYWPQAWLGLTFNWGALVGYAALTGTLSTGAFAIYVAGIFWTLGYDTIYAHQDKEDDALIGVKSTALRFGNSTKTWLVVFYGGTIGFLAIAGLIFGLSPIYYVALMPAAVHFALQIRKLDIHDGHNCLTIFKSNKVAGLWVLLAPLCEIGVRFLEAY